MNEHLLNLTRKYRQKGILIDTNILLLYLIGSFDINLIRNFSRTANFTVDDFSRVSRFIDYFEVKVTTPHILTEVSNLFGNKNFLNALLATYINLSSEKFVESARTIENQAFNLFGLTDTAIAEISKDSYLILTDDRPLFGYLANKGFDIVSLDQIRMI